MDKLKHKLLSLCTLPALGLVITTCYLLGTTWLLFDRIEQLKTMPLNEIGDFLAGIFGALAFFWLVIGYFMQNSELKNQIKEFQKNLDFQVEKEQREIRSALPIISAAPLTSDNTDELFKFISDNHFLNPSELNGEIEQNFSEIKIPITIEVFNNAIYKVEIINEFNPVGFFLNKDIPEKIKIPHIEKNTSIEIEIIINKKHIIYFMNHEINFDFCFYDTKGNLNNFNLGIIILKNGLLVDIFDGMQI